MIYLTHRILNKLIFLFIGITNKLFRARISVYMMHWIEQGPEQEFTISLDSFKLFLSKIQNRPIVSLENINWKDVSSYNNAVLITFDDVTASFFQYAYPILKECSIPFSVFITTDFIDKEGYITMADLKVLAQDPLCTIGSHSVSHRWLIKLSKQEIIEELRSSKEMLQHLTGRTVEYFAFPHGTYSTAGFRNKKLLKKYYTRGFSTMPTPITQNPFIRTYFLPRINLTQQRINKLVKS